jgi:hypothetical protein
MACWLRPLRLLLWPAAGIVVVGCLVAAYHYHAFGGPFTPGYAFSTKGDRGQGVYMGLGTASPIAVVQLLFLPWRGLFFSAPWLLLSIPGVTMMLRSRRLRAEGWLCTVVPLLFIWMNGSMVDWAGGYTFGARYLIPALPFMALAVGATLSSELNPDRTVHLRALIAITLGLASVGLMLIATAVRPEVPWQFHSPFGDFLVPLFVGGHLAVNTQTFYSAVEATDGSSAAWNLGQLMQLHGLLSLAPLALFAAGFCLWMRRLTEPNA